MVYNYETASHMRTFLSTIETQEVLPAHKKMMKTVNDDVRNGYNKNMRAYNKNLQSKHFRQINIYVIIIFSVLVISPSN